MARIVLDTNIISEILREKDLTISALNGYTIFFIPAIVYGEIKYGIKNSTQKEPVSERFIEFINRCIPLEVDFLAADDYATIRHQLKKAGRPIPENDIWIAATCMANGLPLMTRDKHFSYVEDLEVVTPE